MQVHNHIIATVHRLLLATRPRGLLGATVTIQAVSQTLVMLIAQEVGGTDQNMSEGLFAS